VLVIVVLAFVGILATVALWASLTNYHMKVTDKNVTDNFYSAEGVLDQVRVGLQNDASDALSSAYKFVMQQYASLSEDARESNFADQFISALCKSLKYDGETVTDASGTAVAADRLCRIDKLEKYVYVDPSQGSFVLKNGTNDSNKYCFLTIKSNGVVIEDLVVEYTDTKGDLSIIQTDIFLQVPDMDMVGSANAPQVFDYSIIGNAGVEFLGPNTTVAGSVYAGSQYALNNHSATSSDSDYYKSLVIANTANVDFSQAPYVIADGDLLAEGTTGSAYTIATNPDGQVWARNIDLTDATALLAGTTYVGDDMTLYGNGSKAKITGTYAGYNGVVDRNAFTNYTDYMGNWYSSAIILNGKNSVLDMSKAKSILVAGYAYINTSAISTTSSTTTANNTDVTNDSDVLLGESIMVKGDQIAYLVPSECVATVGGTDSKGGTSRYKKNPLTVAEYNAVKADDTCKLVDGNVSTKSGKKLSEYFADGTSEDNMYQMILVPSKTGNPDDGLVYLYLKLDETMASQYFMDYYNAGDEKLKKYNAFYTDGINAIGADTTIYTAGTYAEYTEEKLDGKDVPTSLKYATGTDSINGVILNLPGTYKALTTKLVTDVTTLTDMDADDVFQNVIDKNYFQNFLSNCTGRTFTASQSGTGGEELHVVMVDNEGGSTYVFNDSNSKHVYILIATGDVRVDTNFTGTLIANGKVTVGNASNITVQKTTIENIKKLMVTQCEDNNGKTANLYTFFKDGSAYMSNGFVGSGTTGSGTTDGVTLSDLVVYQNWKKK
jgi:hypothetical protein